jgi:hypothetical protein
MAKMQMVFWGNAFRLNIRHKPLPHPEKPFAFRFYCLYIFVAILNKEMEHGYEIPNQNRWVRSSDPSARANQ